MEPFAQVEDVQRRLDFDLDEAERSAVSAELEDMSNEARFVANRDWPNPDTAPNMVRQTVIKAVVRWARNMNGYITSRAGDETLTWSDVGREAGAPEFLPKEVKLLVAIGDGRTGKYRLGTAEIVAYTPADRTIDDGLVMIAGARSRQSPDDGRIGTIGGGNDPFPFNQPDGSVW